MKIIAKNRGCGKTHDLIKLANQTNGVIVCMSKRSAQLVADTAHRMGVEIKVPICYNQLLGVGVDTKLLFDNAEYIFGAVLREMYGVDPAQIAAATVTSSSDETDRLQLAAKPLVGYLRSIGVQFNN